MDRHDFLKTLTEELARLGWSEEELTRRRKGNPWKMALAARLCRGRTLTVKAVCARLHNWMQGGTPVQ